MSSLVASETTTGFERGLEQMFREHYPMLYRTALSILDNPADADDVPQTIFLRLLRSGMPAEMSRNPGGYLYRAAVNTSLNVVRTRKRQRLTDGIESLEIVVDTSSTSTKERMHTLKGPMLQTLLEDRFKLKMQRDVIEEQVYELLDAGFKPQALKDGDCEARKATIEAANSNITDPLMRALAGGPGGLRICGFQAIGGPSDGSAAPPGTRTVNVHGGSLDLLIRNLSLDRIVLDRTGLKGIYDRGLPTAW